MVLYDIDTVIHYCRHMCVIWSWRTYDYLLGFIPSKLGVTGRVSWLRCVVHWAIGMMASDDRAQRAPSEQFHCGKPKLHVLISFSLFIPKGLEQRNNIYSKKYFFLCLIKRTLFSSVCVLSLELFWSTFFIWLRSAFWFVSISGNKTF